MIRNTTPRLTTAIFVALVALLVATAPSVAQTTAILSLTGEAGDPTPGETLTVTFTVENTDSKTNPAILNVTSHPSGWEITDREDAGGQWRESDGKWLFQGIEAGDTVQPSITFAVPADASGDYTVDATALDTDGNLASTSVSITVDAAGTPEPTATPTEEPTATPTEEPTAAGDDSAETTTSSDGPGFGVSAALLAVLGVAALAALRRRA